MKILNLPTQCTYIYTPALKSATLRLQCLRLPLSTHTPILVPPIVLVCSLLLQGCLSGTVEETRYVTFHRAVQIALDGGPAQALEDFDETNSLKSNTQVVLSMPLTLEVQPTPLVEYKYSFRIEFSNIPSTGETKDYVPTTDFGFINDFAVSAVELTGDDENTADVNEAKTNVGSVTAGTKLASITGIDFSIDDTTVNNTLVEHESVSTSFAYQYTISFTYSYKIPAADPEDDDIEISRDVVVTGEAHVLIKHFEEKSQTF